MIPELAVLRHGSLLTFWRFTYRIIIIIIIIIIRQFSNISTAAEQFLQ